MKKYKLKLNSKIFKFYFLNLILSRKANGFTLIEILVSLGVFMTVMTITMAAFLNISDIQKKTEAFRKVNDNLNFTMEAMMREIREGRSYSNSGISFSFDDKSGNRITYALNNLNNDGGYIERKIGNDSQRMTSDGINITNLSFSVRGQETGDRQQPLVIISISGKSGVKEKLTAELNLQTTVSQRKLDS